jgi:exopolysaccharide biosynthesis WecB/TagA/CpsF family protein
VTDKHVEILNLKFGNHGVQEMLSVRNGVIVPVNVDMLMKMQNNYQFWRFCSSADYLLCDSQILYISSKLLPGKSFKEKISGSDFFPRFCDHNKDNEDFKVFLMGAAEGVAKLAKNTINNRLGREVIVEAYSPSFGFENDFIECENIVEQINSSGATVLAIGVGAPKQELWISKYKESLQNIKVFIPIGATIDFEAGRIDRAPKWLSKFGLEWLFRLVKEPKRLWRRYLVDDLPYFKLILLQLLGKYTPPNFKKEVDKK